jgi:hypothetical protein
MDEELIDSSGNPDGEAAKPPAAPLCADWNTSLAAPAFGDRLAASSHPDGPVGGSDAEHGASTVGAGSPRAGSTGAGESAGRRRPPWQDPAELPAVQRAHTGAFGVKLRAIDEAKHLLLAALASIDTVGLTDPEAVALLQAVEAAGRPVDAARVATAAVIGDRARRGLGRDSLAWRMGAASPSELLTRLTNMSAWEMNRRVRLGERVTPRSMGGSRMEPDFPIVAAALTAGELSLDSAAQIVGALADFTRHGRFDADPAQVEAAEAAMVESATGSVFGRRLEGDNGALGEVDGDAHRDGGPVSGADGPIGRLGDSQGFTFPADLIRGMGQEWRAVLNPDGAAPNDATSEAKSTFSFGTTLKDGLYPLRGGFTPELKGIVSNVFNTYMSARSGPSFPSAEDQARIDAGELVPGNALDERTGGEKRADILRGIFTQVAQDPATPTMGGMPPTVMVHVNARDLLSKNGVDLTGVGWIDGVEAPISMRTITRMIDNGGMQPVYIGANGAVLGLGSKARCFTPLQRKAITARDGGCIIDGCDCPPQWTEIHHVVPWEHGGKTEITNGVLLCWYHHHSLGTSGWQIRMRRGMPEVKGPPWLDPAQKWRVPRRHRASRAA